MIKVRFAVIMLLLLAPALSWGYSLGEPVNHSFINEKLDVSIPIQGYYSSINISLSSASDRDLLDIPNSKIFNKIKSKIGKDYQLHVFSDKPIKTRSFSVPFTMASDGSKHIQLINITLKNKKPGKLTLPSSRQQVVPVKIGNGVLHELWNKVGFYKVKRGDYMFGLVPNITSSGNTFKYRSIVLAIYNKNKDAFIGGDINRLKAGYVLKMPDAKYIQSMYGKPLPLSSDARVIPEKVVVKQGKIKGAPKFNAVIGVGKMADAHQKQDKKGNSKIKILKKMVNEQMQSIDLMKMLLTQYKVKQNILASKIASLQDNSDKITKMTSKITHMMMEVKSIASKNKGDIDEERLAIIGLLIASSVLLVLIIIMIIFNKRGRRNSKDKVVKDSDIKGVSNKKEKKDRRSWFKLSKKQKPDDNPIALSEVSDDEHIADDFENIISENKVDE